MSIDKNSVLQIAKAVSKVFHLLLKLAYKTVS
jgi:hypothetical protein